MRAKHFFPKHIYSSTWSNREVKPERLKGKEWQSKLKYVQNQDKSAACSIIIYLSLRSTIKPKHSRLMFFVYGFHSSFTVEALYAQCTLQNKRDDYWLKISSIFGHFCIDHHRLTHEILFPAIFHPLFQKNTNIYSDFYCY